MPRPEEEKNATVTHIHPAARVLAVSASATVEAYTTYLFDVYKNVRMAKADARKMPSSSLQILKSITQPSTFLSTVKTETQLTTDRILRTTVGPQYDAMRFANIQDCYTALRCSYRGVSMYWFYKMCNRGLKFGAQVPLMEAMMATQTYQNGAAQLGENKSKVMASIASGSLLGVLEVAVNPIDRAKIIMQTEKISYAQMFERMKQEGLSVHYSAWRETIYRNVIGSGTLFGSKYLIYSLQGLKDHNNPTFTQSFISSALGTGIMITLSHLPDVAKVRAQTQKDHSVKVGMFKRLSAIAAKDGVHALFEGLVPKLIGSGVKGTLIMTACEMMVRELNHLFTEDKHHKSEYKSSFK